MLAIITRKSIDVDYLLKFRQLAETGKVAKGRRLGHTDGWGMVAYNNDFPTYLGRQPTNELNDPRYETACNVVRRERIRGIIFCQLRKRSVGKKNIDNTPPLIEGRFCFMHNGTVHKLGNSDKSDSVRLHRMITSQISKGHSVLESLRTTYCQGIRVYKYTSLTSVLSNGKSVYATKHVSPRHNEEYYDLMYVKNNDFMIISQEKTWEMNWEKIKNGKTMIVDFNLEPIIEDLFKR